MTEIEDGFVLQALSARGEAILAESGLADGSDRMGKVKAARKAANDSLVPSPNWQVEEVRRKVAERFTELRDRKSVV